MTKFIIILGLFITGCSSESDFDVSSQTLKLRQSAPPKAKQYFLKAKNAAAQKSYATALAWADSAEQYAPQLADISNFRGQIYTALHRNKEALTAFKRTAQRDERYAGVWFQLGNNAFTRQQYGEAISYFEKELALARSKRGEYAKLANRHRVCQTLLQLARCRSNQGQIAKAEQACLAAITEDSTFAEAFGDLAYYQKFRGDQDAALQSIRRAVQLRPSNPDYLYTLGLLQLQIGDAPAAVQTLQKVIRHSQVFDDKVYYNLGLALNQTGKLTEGKRLLQIVDSLHTRQGKIFQARYRVELSPEMPGPWMNLAKAYEQAGQKTQARQALQRALNLDPENENISKALQRLNAK